MDKILKQEMGKIYNHLSDIEKDIIELGSKYIKVIPSYQSALEKIISLKLVIKNLIIKEE